MHVFPPISLGHLSYVVLWALLGMCVSAVALPNGEMPTARDYLAGTLGISFEALGLEIAHGHPSMVVPLAAALLFALLIRHLPVPECRPRFRSRRMRLRRVFVSTVTVFGFFWLQVTILLLSYRGWWDMLVLYPEV